MKITKQHLKKVIKEELELILEKVGRLKGYEDPTKNPEFLKPTLAGQIGSKPVQQKVPDLDQATKGKVAAGKKAAEARKAREKLRKTSLARKLKAFEEMEKDLAQHIRNIELSFEKVGTTYADVLDNYPEKSKDLDANTDDIKELLDKVRRHKRHTIKLMRRQGMKSLAAPLRSSERNK